MRGSTVRPCFPDFDRTILREVDFKDGIHRRVLEFPFLRANASFRECDLLLVNGNVP